ncbi:exodeoxyribonuclease VII small subunit [Paraoerskovia marina]|uniref:exodeoxyribonuclease VII small subunit n=1 Tax=Paraoerskovia marina TaxID=545619 RepID=UPI000492847A|nr:exodeoxyribonuclease VII small subunit [Paraoerskovia marina]
MSTEPTTPDAGTADVAQLGYEEARDELVSIVARLESGGEPLEASLALWERGEALANRCQTWLDGARERIDAAQAGSSSTAKDGPEADGR